jgi:hypothetical protein
VDWYAVHTRRGCEAQAAAHLERRFCVTTYVPMVCRRLPAGSVRESLFPGYLFMAATAGDIDLDAIDQALGCGRLVRPAGGSRLRGLAPVVLPSGCIEALRRWVAALEASSGLPAPRRNGGGTVTGDHRPLDWETAFAGPMAPPARIALLRQWLGEDTPAAEEEDSTCSPGAKRLRRTRGKGRKIRYG